MLLDIQNLTMDEQRKHIDNTIEDWMKEHDQIDDIIVIGAKF
jgi:hypothetical protein